MSHSEPTQTNEDERDVQVPEPEVLPRAKRRRFSAEYKLRILEEVDGCTQRGQIGALLRREGLYSSHLSTWRQQRLLGQLEGLSPKKRGRKPQDPAVEEVEQDQCRGHSGKAGCRLSCQDIPHRRERRRIGHVSGHRTCPISATRSLACRRSQGWQGLGSRGRAGRWSRGQSGLTILPD
jgi:transposase-like protein